MAYSPQKWFDSLCRNMSESTQNDGPVRTPKICVVYPTVETATERLNKSLYKTLWTENL